jgi:hypothetical protein
VVCAKIISTQRGKEMTLQQNITDLILYDRKNIFEQINLLKQQLDISEKIDKKISYLDDIESVYARNFDFEKDSEGINNQIIDNANKNLELMCRINGKTVFIKDFGKINSIPRKKLILISEFIILSRLSKKINEVSYYASMYYKNNKKFDHLSLEDKNELY